MIRTDVRQKTEILISTKSKKVMPSLLTIVWFLFTYGRNEEQVLQLIEKLIFMFLLRKILKRIFQREKKMSNNSFLFSTQNAWRFFCVNQTTSIVLFFSSFSRSSFIQLSINCYSSRTLSFLSGARIQTRTYILAPTHKTQAGIYIY